jgi:hypothetical protein
MHGSLITVGWLVCLCGTGTGWSTVDCRLLKGHISHLPSPSRWSSTSTMSLFITLSTVLAPAFQVERRAFARLSRACLSASATASDEKKKNEQFQRQALLDEAAALARALFRTCIRSVRVIRHGNEVDEREFTEREEQRLESNDNKGDNNVRLSMLSMLPPVDREDELRSRAEYYSQYTRENFYQESDCLSHDEWQEQHISRFLYHLKRGDNHRKWLLDDMKFTDPYMDAFDHDRVAQFEDKALTLVREIEERKREGMDPKIRAYLEKFQHSGDNDDENDDETDSDDDDDSPQGLPGWYKNPRNDM